MAAKDGRIKFQKTFNENQSSYGIKHIIEKDIQHYISNGDVKFAFEQLNLDFKRIKDRSINYCYKLKIHPILGKYEKLKPKYEAIRDSLPDMVSMPFTYIDFKIGELDKKYHRAKKPNPI